MLTNKGTESCDRTTVHRIKKCLPRAPGGNLADRLGAGECNDLGNGEVYIFQKSPAYFPREGRRHIVRARIQRSYETKTHIARIVRDFHKKKLAAKSSAAAAAKKSPTSTPISPAPQGIAQN
jgi:hypothetical protein